MMSRGRSLNGSKGRKKKIIRDGNLKSGRQAGIGIQVGVGTGKEVGEGRGSGVRQERKDEKGQEQKRSIIL